jgi:hypothetical protein
MSPKKEIGVTPEYNSVSNNQDMSELISSMNKLVTRVDKLVSLFEEASKNVAEVESTEAKIAALSNRLEVLLEQNKSIAQGLLLLEKYVRGKTGLQQ